jgi:hypothetical protein
VPEFHLFFLSPDAHSARSQPFLQLPIFLRGRLRLSISGAIFSFAPPFALDALLQFALSDAFMILGSEKQNSCERCDDYYFMPLVVSYYHCDFIWSARSLPSRECCSLSGKCSFAIHQVSGAGKREMK